MFELMALPGDQLAGLKIAHNRWIEQQQEGSGGRNRTRSTPTREARFKLQEMIEKDKRKAAKYRSERS